MVLGSERWVAALLGKTLVVSTHLPHTGEHTSEFEAALAEMQELIEAMRGGSTRPLSPELREKVIQCRSAARLASGVSVCRDVIIGGDFNAHVEPGQPGVSGPRTLHRTWRRLGERVREAGHAGAAGSAEEPGEGFGSRKRIDHDRRSMSLGCWCAVLQQKMANTWMPQDEFAEHESGTT